MTACTRSGAYCSRWGVGGMGDLPPSGCDVSACLSPPLSLTVFGCLSGRECVFLPYVVMSLTPYGMSLRLSMHLSCICEDVYAGGAAHWFADWFSGGGGQLACFSGPCVLYCVYCCVVLCILLCYAALCYCGLLCCTVLYHVYCCTAVGTLYVVLCCTAVPVPAPHFHCSTLYCTACHCSHYCYGTPC